MNSHRAVASGTLPWARVHSASEAPPSVAFVLPGFPRYANGGFRVVYEYANYLATVGSEVAVLHMHAHIPSDESRTIFRTHARRAFYRLMTRKRPGWFALAAQITVRNAPSQDERLVPRADVLVATSALTAHFVSRVAAERGSIPVYLLQHFEDFSLPRAEVETTWRLPMAKIAVSEWLADIGQSLGVRVRVIPNAIDTAVFRPGPRLSVRSPSVLGMVSDHPFKRTDVLLGALRLLEEQRPGVRISTFGTIARPRGLPASAVHHRNPSRSHLAGLYQSAQVFAAASDAEGFGLPVAEALASGCAVVSTDVAGVRSFAGDAVTYTPTGDPAQLAGQVMALLDDVPRAQRLADRGTALIRARHERATAAQSFLRVLQELVAAERAT